jgi:hypothetical protein
VAVHDESAVAHYLVVGNLLEGILFAAAEQHLYFAVVVGELV